MKMAHFFKDFRRTVERLRTAAERRRLGAGVQARAQELFSFDRHADGLVDIYQQVL